MNTPCQHCSWFEKRYLEITDRYSKSAVAKNLSMQNTKIIKLGTEIRALQKNLKAKHQVIRNAFCEIDTLEKAKLERDKVE